MVRASRVGAADRASRAALAVACLLASLAAIAWNAWAGPEWSWDRLQYHLYGGFRLTHDVEGLGLAPAGGQSFLNPLVYLPGWLLSRAGLDEFGVSSVLAVLHGACVVAVWDIARQLFATLRSTAAQVESLAVLSAVLAFLTPVFLLEVGTSYADVTTTLPLLAGVSFALRARRDGRNAWWLVAGLAIGLAAGLKLSNAPAALCGLLLLWQPGAGRTLTRFAVFAAGGLAGAALGHGAWSLRLWRETGNPVYPMFDRWIVPGAPDAGSAAAATADVLTLDRIAWVWEVVIGTLQATGTRFTPRSLRDWLDFPLRVADPSLPLSGAYIESFQPDPRLALLAVLAAACVLVALVRAVVVRSRATAQPDAAAQDGPQATGRPMDDRPMVAFAAFWSAWYLLWTVSSSNGRYAIGLLMLTAPMVVACTCTLLRQARVRSYALLLLLLVQATWALVIADPRGYPIRTEWSDGDLRVAVPPELAGRPVLHLTGWTTSWSFLAPWMPTGSAFANLAQATDQPLRGLEPARARRLIEDWRGPVRVLEAAIAVRGGRPAVEGAQREGIDAWLARWDLAVDPDDCVGIGLNVMPLRSKMIVFDDAGGRLIRDADRVLSCGVRPAPGAADRAREWTHRHDDLFAALEHRCAAQLEGSRNGSLWLGGRTWHRDYQRRGLRLIIEDGKMRVADELGRGRELGPVDLLRVGVDQFDCTWLVPARTADGGRRFGDDAGVVDFGNLRETAPVR